MESEKEIERRRWAEGGGEMRRQVGRKRHTQLGERRRDELGARTALGRDVRGKKWEPQGKKTL